jgi:DNA mismatch repair protein MutS2
MHPKSLTTLEFPKILARLADHTAFSAGRELALALQPSNEPAVVAQWLQETREALQLVISRATIQFGGAHDVRPQISHARIGATLRPEDLLAIRDTHTRARTIRRTLTRLAADAPRLAAIARQLQDDSRAADEIARCVNDRAEVVDHASPELARIRRELKVTQARLLEKLQRMIGSSDYGKYIQEPIITQRSGRYVIPVKADSKGRVQGLVHDQSASGATVFVEPLATVELNNELRELQIKEQKEVERILAELTAHVAEEGDAIVASVEALAELDLAFAKAYYAEALRAREPLISTKGNKGNSGDIQGDKGDAPSPLISPNFPQSPLILINARHPLLNQETVVPISLQLDAQTRILVITGPNTGGKTVTLKTTGLLVLMAQAGLFVPASDGTTLPILDDVFADIGDEQSIEQSLSTFSSHIRNVVEFLREARERSLVLLDEVGAGTDPAEGSALAQAILEHLRTHHIMALVATHYTELKLYAHSTAGVKNASVEFDVETLRPTYRLTVGLPGRSNALAIAERLGLDKQIIEAARARVAGEQLEADALLADLKQARETAETQQRAAEQARREAHHLEREWRERLKQFEEEKHELINKLRRDAEQEMELVRAELTEVRKRLHHARIAADFTAEQRKLDELAQHVEPLMEAQTPTARREPETFTVGESVWIASLNQRGEILALSPHEAEAQVGSVRMKLRLAQLEKYEGQAPTQSYRQQQDAAVLGAKAAQRAALRAVSPNAPTELSSELHLRGMRAEEAVIELEKYLDDAYLAGQARVRVVHGKGTGALRKAVRALLEQHSLVASFRAGERHEGEDGVTIVELVGR